VIWAVEVFACNVICVLAVLEPEVAVIVAVCVLAIVPDVAVNVAPVTPLATVTEAGTVNAVLLDERVTFDPPVPAAWDSCTPHVVELLGARVVAAHPTSDIVVPGAVTTTAVDTVAPFRVAVIITV
jgi:hypothetical protein